LIAAKALIPPDVFGVAVAALLGGALQKHIGFGSGANTMCTPLVMSPHDGSGFRLTPVSGMLSG
jgi:hypothetical protein